MGVTEVDFGKPDTQEQIVELLESLLEMAKDGTIQSIIVGTRASSGYYESLWRFPHYHYIEAIGMAASLQADIHADGMMRKLAEVAEAAGVEISE